MYKVSFNLVEILASQMFGLKEIFIVSILFGNRDISLGSISKGYSMYKEKDTGKGDAEETSIF